MDGPGARHPEDVNFSGTLGCLKLRRRDGFEARAFDGQCARSAQNLFAESAADAQRCAICPHVDGPPAVLHRESSCCHRRVRTSTRLEIVRTYRDDGESGLGIKNRPGLIGLIADVCQGRANFDHILIYDVSRFQDTDESAHYEFVCREAGVTVSYCAEQFESDGTVISSIVKNINWILGEVECDALI